MAPFERKRFIPHPENDRLLRDAFGRFATGVTIVTTAVDDGCIAITANSFSSVSLDPPLVLWSPSRKSKRFVHFVEAEHYAIHVLAADQRELAFNVAKDGGALLRAPLGTNAEGVPILDDCLARFDCARNAVHDGGDHAIVVGRVLHAELRDGDPLAFYSGKVARIDID